MQYLLDKLFTKGYKFNGKISAATMTSQHIYDDLILNRAWRLNKIWTKFNISSPTHEQEWRGTS